MCNQARLANSRHNSAPFKILYILDINVAFVHNLKRDKVAKEVPVMREYILDVL
jgi:hypothetical protein